MYFLCCDLNLVKLKLEVESLFCYVTVQHFQNM